MRSRKLLGLAVILVLAVTPLVAQAARSSHDHVTGGGQVQPPPGAGDTIAFAAQGTDNSSAGPARGQWEYIQRSANAGPQHGTIDCLYVPSSSFAEFTGPETGGGYIKVEITDNKSPASDMIVITTHTDDNCGNTSGNSSTALARGNATIHDSDG